MSVDGTGSQPGSGAQETTTIVLNAGDGPSLVIPGGADFLLNADFARSGDDLVLTGQDGARVTVRDYFTDDTPPVLETAGGARVPPDLATALAGPETPGMVAQAGGLAGNEPIGTVKSVHGEVYATRGSGTVDTLLPDDPVFRGDVLTTGNDSQVGIVFVDGTNFSVAANARMVLDNLVYGASLGNEGMGVSVLQGAFAFITGSIAKGDGDGMSVRTPVATIGIRGTTVNGDVEVEGADSRFTLTPDFVSGHVGTVEVRNAGGRQILDQAFESTTVSSFFVSPTQPTIIPPVEFDALHDLPATLLEQIYLQYLEDERRREDGDDSGGGGGGEQHAGDPTAEQLAAIGPAAGNGGGVFSVTAGLNLVLLPPIPELDLNLDQLFSRSRDGFRNGDNNDFFVNFDTENGVFLVGTDGDDVLLGTNFNDVIFGGAGNDRIFGFGGDDVLRGEEDDDFIDGGPGNDDIVATPGVDEVVGGSGNDVIDTGEDDDTITGGEGNDTIDGGTGEDTAIYSGAFADGAGYDITIVDGTVTITDTDPGDGDDGTDTLTNVENLEFSDVTLDITTLPSVSVAGATVDEDAGTVTFTITKTGATVLPLTVAFATADGTAVAGADYTAVAGSVTFAPGETEKTVVVSVSDDGDTETAESFSLNLSNPVNGTIGTGSAAATINDNDTPPVVDAGLTFAVAENSAPGTAVGTVTGGDADGDTLQGFQIVSGNDDGFFQIDADTGAITVAPGAGLDHEGTDTYTLGVTVSDGALTSAVVDVTVSVTDENETPSVDGGQVFAIAENTAADVLVGTVTGSDPDGDTLQDFQIVSGNDDGFFAIDGSGNITVAAGADLNHEAADSYTLGVTVSDGTNTSAPVNVSVTVTDENEPPSVDGGQAFAVAENSAAGSAIGTVTGSDPDGDTLQGFQIVSGNDDGFFTIDDDGNITVAAGADLDHEAADSYTLGVTVSDGTNTSAPVDVTVSVTDENEPPSVDGGQAFAVAENTAAGVLVGTVTGSDPDGDTLQGFQIVSGNADGFFAIDDDGNITVAAGSDLNHEAADSYTLGITVSDGTNTSLPIDVMVTITDVNETPSVDGGQAFNIAENSVAGATIGFVAASDPDDDPAFNQLQNYQIVSGNSDGFFQIDATTGEITVAAGANLNHEAADSYTLGVTVSDGINTSDPVDVTVTVGDENETPSVDGGQAFNIAENSAAGVPVGVVTGGDPDGNALQGFQIVSGNDDGFFAIDASTGAITVAAGADLDHESADSYTLGVIVSDGALTSAPVDVTVTITDVNETPSVDGGQAFNIAENSGNGAAVGAVAAGDPDDDPAFNQLQNYQIVSGNDDGFFQIDASTGAITVAAGANLNHEAVDSYTLGVTVSDGTNTSDPVNVTVNVTDVNETPVVADVQAFDIAENSGPGATVGFVAASDPDTDPAFNQLQSYQIVSGNGDGFFAINGATGEITVAAGADLDHEDTDSYTLGVTVSDGSNTSDPVDVTVNVTDENETPSVDGGQAFTIAENGAAGTPVGVVTGSDPDGDTLQGFQIVSGNDDGFFQIDADTGAITVAAGADLNFEGTDSYTLGVTASDGTNTSDPVDVAISVTDVNETPSVIAEQTFAVAENSSAGAAVGTVLAGDPDTDPTFNDLQGFQIVAGNADGFFQIDADTGAITVAAGADLNFEDTATYLLDVAVSDGTNTSDPVTVTVNVTDVNETPSVIAEQTFAIAENSTGGTAVGTVLANDPDTDPAFNDLQGYQIVAGNDDGVFQIDADSGAITVAPGTDLNFEDTATYLLDVAVSDGTNSSDPVTVTVNVTDVNETPSVIAEQTFAIAENSTGGTAVGTVLANDPDTDPAFNDLQGFQIVAGNDDGVFQIDADTGAITVAAGADLNFEDTATYLLDVSVSDGTNSSDPVTVTVNVTDVNETPVIDNVIPDQTTAEFAAFEFTFATDTFSDPDDGDSLTYTATLADGSALPAWLDFDGATRTFSGTPGEDDDGIVTVRVTATDSGGLSTSDEFAINVEEVSDAPIITASIDSLAYDEGDGVVTIDTGMTLTDHDSPNLNGGSLTVTLNDGTVNDMLSIQDQGTAPGQISIGTNGISVHYTPSAGGNNNAIGQFSGGTSGSDPLVVRLNPNATPEAVQALLRAITYENASDDPSGATRTLQYVAVDNDGNASDPEFITLTVNPVNDAPVISAGQVFSRPEGPAGDTPGVGIVAAIDAEGDTLQNFQIVSGNDAGLFEIDADTGEISIVDGGALDYEDVNTFTLGITVSDGADTSDPVDITINVTDVFEPLSSGSGFSMSGAGFTQFSPDPISLLVDGQDFTVPDGSTIYLGAEFAENGTGTGTLTVEPGSPVEADAVHVSVGGLIDGDGTVMADVYYDGGVLAPGHSVGALTIDGDLVFDGTMNLEIGGTAPAQSDALSVTGDAAFDGGAMAFSFLDGFLPQAGDRFELITVDGAMTAADDGFDFTVDGLADGFEFDVAFADGKIVLSALNDANAGDDILIGGAGNDVLRGGAGADTLTGGSGADLFLYKAISDGVFASADGTSETLSGDVITDFDAAEGDRIGIDGQAFGVTDIVDGENFAVIGGTYDGDNGAGSAWEAGAAAFIVDDTGTLYYDDNGAADGYTIVAETQGVTLQATDLDVQNA